MQDHVIEALPHDYHKGLRVRSYYVLKAVDVLHGKGHKQGSWTAKELIKQQTREVVFILL
jgi:hypothetical protein